MNFSEKNYKHKTLNIKGVSKKIILGIVFVFATVNFVNAASNSCFVKAWTYGAEMGGGDEYLEWYYMNQYYNKNCVEDLKVDTGDSKLN